MLFCLFFFFFFQRKQISQTKIICASRGSWSWSTGAGKHDGDGPCLNIFINWALSVLEQLPQACNMQGIQQAKLSVHANLSSLHLRAFSPTSQPWLSPVWSLCYSKLLSRLIPTEMGHSVTLGCFLPLSKSQVLGMVWTWNLAQVFCFFFCSNWKPLCNVVPGEVGSEGPGGHKLEKIKSFRSCLLTGAIAVMFYSSQPTDKCAQVRGRSETASKRD